MGVNELCIIGVLSEMHIWSMADGAVSITTITNIPVFGPQSWNKTSIKPSRCFVWPFKTTEPLNSIIQTDEFPNGSNLSAASCPLARHHLRQPEMKTIGLPQ